MNETIHQLNWFCLRSLPKHEHIAARQLALEPDVQAYLPRIRFQRSTRQGLMWFTEALFPNYLFARFDLRTGLRKVRSTRGVQNIVHFGNHWPIIPDAVIQELQTSVPDHEVHTISNTLLPGQEVEIAGGAFHGLKGLVNRVVPSRERVEVLLEFLGRQTAFEVPRDAIIGNGNIRQTILR